MHFSGYLALLYAVTCLDFLAYNYTLHLHELNTWAWGKSRGESSGGETCENKGNHVENAQAVTLHG